LLILGRVVFVFKKGNKDGFAELYLSLNMGWEGESGFEQRCGIDFHK
jgi:hypothetical protein